MVLATREPLHHQDAVASPQQLNQIIAALHHLPVHECRDMFSDAALVISAAPLLVRKHCGAYNANLFTLSLLSVV